MHVEGECHAFDADAVKEKSDQRDVAAGLIAVVVEVEFDPVGQP
jgi:hypothetical protein